MHRRTIPPDGRAMATPARAESNRRDRRILGFHPRYQDYVARLTAFSPRLEDLADSFPALLFCIATGYGRSDDRAAAVAAIEAGERLKTAAGMIGLPWWTRKLPAAALCERIEAVPTAPAFDKEIVHLVPPNAAVAAPWLSRLLYATEACGISFALWSARNHRAFLPEATDERFRYECAWAWHSAQPEVAAGGVMRRRWHAAMAPRRVTEEVIVWRRRIALAASLAAQPSARLTCETVGGFDFVPLRDVDDFIGESAAMTNCLDQFADRMETGCVSVVSMRCRDRPVADVELRIDAASRLPRIVQIKRARNRAASDQQWEAAREWLRLQQPQHAACLNGVPSREICRALLAIWKPYLDWLPMRHASTFELHLKAAEHARSKAAGSDATGGDNARPTRRPARMRPACEPLSAANGTPTRVRTHCGK